MNDDLNSYINMIYNYQKKLLALQQYTPRDKLAINDDGELYIQPCRPWRYIIRKIKNQNRHVLSFYLSNIINEYIKVLEIIILNYKNKKEDKIKKILEDIIDFIYKISYGFITLRNYYNLKNDSHHISLTLETNNNRLNLILTKIKLAV